MLLSRLINNGHCWLWTGPISKKGYGVISAKGSRKLVHRAAYEFFVAEIPNGLTIDHSCCVRNCVNPDHLAVVSASENSKLRWVRNPHKPPSACKGGHSFDEVGFYVRKDKEGYRFRVCKVCEKARDAIRKKAKRLATG